MSVFEVLQRRGTLVLLRFFVVVAWFLLLHLIRIPFVLIARVLEVAMRRADTATTRAAADVPTGPINHWFPPQTGQARKEAVNVHT